MIALRHVDWRRPILPLAALICALAADAALASTAALGYDDARHLLARTGFGPTDAEVHAFAPLSRAEAVDRLLSGARLVAVTPPPPFTFSVAPLRRLPAGTVSEAERMAYLRQRTQEALELRGWWVQEMLATPSPLTERMTLFWHNHFVSAQPKVPFARLMYEQNVRLRANALGNFGTLLHAMGRDPAMVLYLDSVQNRKGAPNENFAREVMELFTLGEGHYTETDVKEAARAFTGFSLDRDTGTFVFRPRLHDDGMKTIFGRRGDFDGDAVLDLILAQPDVATFITAKLWREFVSPDPDSAEVARIARRFRESGYEIKVALRELLTSGAFYAKENRGVLVKSPVEVVVGTLHQLGLAPANGLPFAIASATMGQNLMAAPNVKGWPGGDAWINATTLLARKQFRERITRGDDVAPVRVALLPEPSMAATADQARAPEGLTPQISLDVDRMRRARYAREMERGLADLGFDSARWMAQFPGATAAAREHAAQRLLLATAPQAEPDYGADSLTFLRGVLQDAAYELK
jgi:uncharacterized protein (DUF1800 family)